MFEKRKDIATVNIWQNGHVTINRGFGYARYFDHVTPSDIRRVETLSQNKKHVRKLKNAYGSRLRFYWYRNDKHIYAPQYYKKGG